MTEGRVRPWLARGGPHPIQHSILLPHCSGFSHILPLLGRDSHLCNGSPCGTSRDRRQRSLADARCERRPCLGWIGRIWAPMLIQYMYCCIYRYFSSLVSKSSSVTMSQKIGLSIQLCFPKSPMPTAKILNVGVIWQKQIDNSKVSRFAVVGAKFRPWHRHRVVQARKTGDIPRVAWTKRLTCVLL